MVSVTTAILICETDAIKTIASHVPLDVASVVCGARLGGRVVDRWLQWACGLVTRRWRSDGSSDGQLRPVRGDRQLQWVRRRLVRWECIRHGVVRRGCLQRGRR
jgi:hypothetical protein